MCHNENSNLQKSRYKFLNVRMKFGYFGGFMRNKRNWIQSIFLDNTNQKGFSLVEVLVASGVGAIVILGLASSLSR